MTNENQTDAFDMDRNEKGFFDRPFVTTWILRIFYVVCGLLLLVDFFIHRHVVTDIEKIPAFYPVFGFIACTISVVVAIKIRAWLSREAAYYATKDTIEMDSSIAKAKAGKS